MFRDGVPVDEAPALDHVADAVASGDGVFVWVDLPAPDPDALATLEKQFSLHLLTIEDVTHEHQRPKIEEYDGYFYLVAYGVESGHERLRLHELSIWVSRSWAITVNHTRPDLTGDLHKRLARDPEQMKVGGAFFTYALLDLIVDAYFPAVDRLLDRIERLEEELVFKENAAEAGTGQQTAYRARRDVIYFRRAVAPLREVLNVLLRNDNVILQHDLETYVRDLYDHVVRVSEDLDTARDLTSAALDAHLSVISNRMNEVVLKVSAWAAIIALPTVIASIYGMNFRVIPELHWGWGYPYALSLMAVSGGGLYAYFKRRHWL